MHRRWRAWTWKSCVQYRTQIIHHLNESYLSFPWATLDGYCRDNLMVYIEELGGACNSPILVPGNMKNFSTFCIPFCIIASLFYFCFTWNNEEATIKKPMMVMWMVNKISIWTYIFVQEVPNVIYKYCCKGIFDANGIYKMGSSKIGANHFEFPNQHKMSQKFKRKYGELPYFILSLHEYFHNFWKCFGASFKLPSSKY